MRVLYYAFSVTVLAACVTRAHAWDPANGDWTKTVDTDLRVMTWNVEDGIRSLEPKTEGLNQWTSLTRIVAALKPDILLLQETADNGSADTVGEMNTVIDLFLHGGIDPFLGGVVTSYVQAYDPDYDLPHVFISTMTDGFNRNVILSRYPFTDLNGDTIATYADPPFLSADEYQSGGAPSTIRGHQFAEIDLPDATYAGDVVIGNSHLKAGGSSSDGQQREDAGRRGAYIIDYWYNGAGTGSPDPNSSVIDVPAATMILDENTPVIWGGDWNEDEVTSGRGPAAWFTEAEFAGSADGTDRDRTDSMYDESVTFCTGDPDTLGSSKLDYIGWQDSIATRRLSFIFETSEISECAEFPPEFDGAVFASGLSNTASDHRPVFADFILPAPSQEPGACCTTSPNCLSVTQATCDGLGGTFGGENTSCSDDFDNDTVANVCDVCLGGDDTVDPDNDGVPSFCDPCPADNPDDTDLDGVCDSDDICPGFPDNVDPDGDGVPTGCDACPLDNPDDTDMDTVCDSDDICPGFDDLADGDGDGQPDDCDPCPADNPDDSDADGVCNSDDICNGFDDAIDFDEDTIPDGCDPCPKDPDPKCAPPPCTDFTDCGDINGDGIRDDACTWNACEANACSSLARTTQADLGGPNGACLIDGVSDGNDRFHGLNCFANTNTTVTGPYDCEPFPPAAINVDAGGAASCVLDGVCDANEAFHALNAFSNIDFAGDPGYPCGCAGPSPQAPAATEPQQWTGLRLQAPRRVRPGSLVDVEVYLTSGLKALRGYQLHLGVSGGRKRDLELVDVWVDPRQDVALPDAAGTWRAYNVGIQQMLAGLDAVDGRPVEGGAYLATFTYRVPRGASGTFTISALHGQSSAERTFLFGHAARPIGISSSQEAQVTVIESRNRK